MRFALAISLIVSTLVSASALADARKAIHDESWEVLPTRAISDPVVASVYRALGTTQFADCFTKVHADGAPVLTRKDNDKNGFYLGAKEGWQVARRDGPQPTIKMVYTRDGWATPMNPAMDVFAGSRLTIVTESTGRKIQSVRFVQMQAFETSPGIAYGRPVLEYKTLIDVTCNAL